MIHGARCTQATLKFVCRPLVLILWICYISMTVDFVDVSFHIHSWFKRHCLNISKSTLCNSAAAFLDVHLWWAANFSQFLGTVHLHFAVLAVSGVACWLGNRSSYMFLPEWIKQDSKYVLCYPLDNLQRTVAMLGMIQKCFLPSFLLGVFM